jgi:tyrosine-protein phosphatase non-receptor type 23
VVGALAGQYAHTSLLFPRADIPCSFLQTKQQYFASLTQYYRALADDAANSHGTCLVRLIYAETLAKEAVTLANTFHSTASGYLSSTHLPSDATTSMQSLTKTHLAQCTERKVQAQKDNDLIYHDILPSESSLPAVEKLVAATPMTIQEVYATPEVEKVVSPDLFQRLVPLQVHESASMYSEEKAKLARAESERQDLANGELEAALSYMGLPAALSVFKNLGQANGGLDSLADPPAEVMRWAEEENSGSSSHELGSGAQGVDAAFRRLDQMKAQASQRISSTIALLDDENRECEKARVKWGHEWTQDPSGLHTKVMRSDLKSNKDALAAASANDVRVRELWESIKPDMMILAGGRPALERAFAEAISRSSAGGTAASLLDLNEEEDKLDDVQVAGMKSLVSEIDELVIKLNKIKRERASTLADMKEKIQNDDISQVLVVNRRNQNMSTQIFAQELEKFKPYQSRIALCNSQQQQTLIEVTQKWKDLTEGKLAKQLQKRFTETEASRRKLVERLRSARDSNAEVRATVSKGLTFYSDLLEIVAALRKNAESFVAERKSERDSLISTREWDDKLKGDAGSTHAYQPRTTSPPARGQSSLHDAMASMSMNSGPPPPPLPQQRQQYASPPPQSAYSYSSPPAAPISSPYDNRFDKGVFADRPPPQTSRQYAPPPPQQSYQSSYASPQSPSYASPSASGLPPPPAQFQSNFQGPASPYSGPPPPQSYQYGGYGQPPPPPPQQRQSSGGYGYGGPPPPPPAPQGQYHPPPPPQQGQSYRTSWQRPAY